MDDEEYTYMPENDRRIAVQMRRQEGPNLYEEVREEGRVAGM